MSDAWIKSPPGLVLDGTWCWVTDGKSIWIARRDEEACGGWTNDDTWEDFDEVVAYYIPLVEPLPPHGEL